MRTLLNVIWLVLSGLWLFISYTIAGIICCVLIVTIPWGIASFRVARYALWPFGRQVVDTGRSGPLSFLGNVVWFLVAGLWITIEHVVLGVLLCVTIVGIPLGIANFKLVPVSLAPLGKEIRDVPGRRGQIVQPKV